MYILNANIAVKIARIDVFIAIMGIMVVRKDALIFIIAMAGIINGMKNDLLVMIALMVFMTVIKDVFSCKNCNDECNAFYQLHSDLIIFVMIAAMIIKLKIVLFCFVFWFGL